MKVYPIVVSAFAENQLRAIGAIVVRRDGDRAADRFIDRILGEIQKLEVFPERGTVRHEIGPGIRVIGVHRSVDLAFVVHEDFVEVLRVTYAGQQLNL